MYRHIAASRLHELSMDEVVLDFEELRHLKICPGCKKLFDRFVEHESRQLQMKRQDPEDRQTA